MAKEKGKFFNVYLDHFKAILELSDRKRGQLMAALILYAETGEVTEGYTGLERVCYDTLRGDIDRSFRNYQKTCERNRAISRTRKTATVHALEYPTQSDLYESLPVVTTRDQSLPVVATRDQSSPVVTNSNSNPNNNNNNNNNNNPNPNRNNPDTLPGDMLPSALNGAALFDQILRGDDDALQSFRMR